MFLKKCFEFYPPFLPLQHNISKINIFVIVNSLRELGREYKHSVIGLSALPSVDHSINFNKNINIEINFYIIKYIYGFS